MVGNLTYFCPSLYTYDSKIRIILPMREAIVKYSLHNTSAKIQKSILSEISNFCISVSKERGYQIFKYVHKTDIQLVYKLKQEQQTNENELLKSTSSYYGYMNATGKCSFSDYLLGQLPRNLAAHI